jgi:HEAT repeat protein
MRDRIDRIFARGKLDSLVKALRGAKVQDVRYAADRLEKALDGTKPVLKYAKDLTKQKEPEAHHLACQLIPACYRHDAPPSLKLLQRLADHENWTVRDAAAEVCGRLLRSDFTGMIDAMREWSKHPSINVRRAVVIAAARSAHPTRPERAEPLLKLLEPLLSDEDPTVRKSLGPSALGGSLLRHYPMEAFEYIVKWSTSNDPPVLWNVAMAFAAGAATPIAKKALIVLRKLSLDDRRLVWRAVSSAMWKLGRRCPEIVRPELMRWLEDERRVDVAREALKHL